MNKEMVYVCVCMFTQWKTIQPKKNEISFATVWMDLENIMVNEIRQIEKDKYCMLSLLCEIEKVKQASENNKTEKKMLSSEI